MGRPDVHRDEPGGLRADLSEPVADPAACYIIMYVVTCMYIYILPVYRQ